MVLTFFFWYFFAGINQPESRENGTRTKMGAYVDRYGFLLSFIAGWPIWATDLYLALWFPWDRFTLVMMFGASVLFVGILELLIQPRLPKIIMISLAVGIASGAQFHYRHAVSPGMDRREGVLSAINLASSWHSAWHSLTHFRSSVSLRHR